MFYKRTKATQSFLITSQHCIYWDEGSRRGGGRAELGGVEVVSASLSGIINKCVGTPICLIKVFKHFEIHNNIHTELG